MTLHIKPLTVDNWDDFQSLFGERGACGGCWCMWWRLTHAEYENQKGEGNRNAMRSLVASGKIPGLVAYDDERPIGWCALAPRQEFKRLERSRILKPVDDTPVWSIVCFFVGKPDRNRGVSKLLLTAAIDHARDQGGVALEGYPVDPTQERVAPLFAYTGLASAYRRAGFVECARRSPTRPIMRYEL